MKSKKTWIIVGVVALLLIVAILFLRKRAQQNKSAENRTAESAYRAVYTVGRFDHKAGKEVAVTITERPAMGSIVANDTVEITGSGPYSGTYPVKKIWEDSNGKLGAIFVDIPGSENLPDTTREYAYANVGKINLI